jgi:hypothetical protein
MDVDPRVPDPREEPVEDIASEGDGDGEGDDPDDDMDDGAGEEDSEVLPGGKGGSNARLTTRQAVLASMVGADHVELGEYQRMRFDSVPLCNVSSFSLQPSTVFHVAYASLHTEAATSSRKKQLTSEEIALRREETARKRKNMSEKKLEDEKVRNQATNFLFTHGRLYTG